MASLAWNHSTTAGIHVMDDQHGILLDALNELRVSLICSEDWQTVRAMLVRVANLIQMHMESEQRLLERHNYPAMEAHRIETQRLLGRLAVLDASNKPWQMSSVYELVEYLRKWFTTHTGMAGQKYGPWLQKCGVQ